ncbi:MAG: tetratricopeptide repeat protein [Candidatus Acidiferrum sp.]
MAAERLHPTDLMKLPKIRLCYAVGVGLAIILMLASPAHISAQNPPASPADPSATPSKKQDAPPAKPSTDGSSQSAPDQPTWDPLRAERDMQVGIFYMHKGDLDAAIDRFQDAALAKPGYALPFLRLGEAQEKKGLKRQAIKSYQRYLDLYPKAEDKDKIQKKIDKLYKEAEKEKKSM